MASIYPNRKDGKIVSFKFKAYLGRDENGKQIFKCMTYTPEKQMSESRLTAQAEKQAVLWEQQVIQEYAAKQAENASRITFENFVNTVWFPSQMNDTE